MSYTWKSQLPNESPEILSIGELQCNGERIPTTTCVALRDERRQSCVLGGTFDHIHPGHKVMLCEAAILTKRRLLIGNCMVILLFELACILIRMFSYLLWMISFWYKIPIYSAGYSYGYSGFYLLYYHPVS